MNRRIRELLERQSGVISRRQAKTAGLKPHDIQRLLRRREWVRVYDGVYVTHTGELSWLQRAWAGVLFAAPAALCADSAIRAADGPGKRDRFGDSRIHVGIDRKRAVVEPPGVRIHQLHDLTERVQWNLSPPRVRIEHALIDVASQWPREVDAIATLADAVQARRTTAQRILDTLAVRRRVPRRKFLADVLQDIAAGTCSVLEHGYLDRVERPHGLPAGSRQPAAWSRRRIYRDVEYVALGLVVELDGRLFHDDAASRDRDLERDLDAVLGGRQTIRVGWGQVFERPCRTAARIGLLLQQRGWPGSPVPCPECRDPDSPGAPESRH